LSEELIAETNMEVYLWSLFFKLNGRRLWRILRRLV
jgi:hypothetical protein